MLARRVNSALRPIFALTVFIGGLAAGLHSDRLESMPAPLQAACGPDKPIVFSGETIRVRAWAMSAGDRNLEYAWSASDGRIFADGTEARWEFAGVWPGQHEARVQVNASSGEVAECTLRVMVRSPARVRDKKYKTGRAFLVTGESEAVGYGLYSYLLLNSRPDAATRERYVRAVIEYLRFTDIALLEIAGIDSARLNITYLPVDTQPGPEILETLGQKDLKDEDLAPIAEWVLRHYDYIRAEIMLDMLGGNHDKGPYLVSVRKPHDWQGEIDPPYLFQDQSWVPPNLVSEWMNVFLNQAAQEQFWDEQAGEKLVLVLRTVIGVVAAGVPEVKNSLTGWISWIKKMG